MKLYRILREQCQWNQNDQDYDILDIDVLYCGYDRLEAIRAYHSYPKETPHHPWKEFWRVRGQSKEVVIQEQE